MLFSFRYGKKKIAVELTPENLLGTIEPQKMKGVIDPVQAVRAALEQPIGSPRLSEIAAKQKQGKVVIIVNDLTRPTPYQYMLPPLLDELAEAGIKDDQITFVVATGNHRGHWAQENKELYTEEIAGKYSFINHDSTKDLAALGKLANGTQLLVNRHVAKADLVITTGLINPHQIAGFSGGRKSIMPGVVGKELITQNHSLMTMPSAKPGNYRDNPVHHMMMEVAQKVGVDFILNVVINSSREIVKVVAGHLEQAWVAGVDVSKKINMVKLKEQAEVVIAGAGGYPKDLNVYQAQKSLTNAAKAVKPGGTIILVAQCGEGYGDQVFEDWIRAAGSIAHIFKRFEAGFELGGHKAYALAQVLKDKEVVLVSDLPKKDVEQLFFTYAENINEALDYVAGKHGTNYRAWVIPEAGIVFPG